MKVTRTTWILKMSEIDLDGAWTVLATSPPASGISVSPTGDQVVAGPLLVGIDHESRRHLLIPLLLGEAVRTNRTGSGVQLGRLAHEGTHYLSVYCLVPELHTVFTQFCRELILTVRTSSSPARDAAEALNRWRALFADAERHPTLNDEALTGLIGELLVVERLLAFGASKDLSYWVGPNSAVHDIRTASHAIEVKATLVREGRIVSISSIEQLQEPSGADLVLVHTRLDRDPGGFDLAELVDRLISAGAERYEVERRLRELRIGDASQYTSRRFRIADTRSYRVPSTAFPRVIRSSFVGGDLPPGILHLGYAIDLTNEPPHPLSDAADEAAFKALAMEAAGEVAT